MNSYSIDVIFVEDKGTFSQLVVVDLTRASLDLVSLNRPCFFRKENQKIAHRSCLIGDFFALKSSLMSPILVTIQIKNTRQHWLLSLVLRIEPV